MFNINWKKTLGAVVIAGCAAVLGAGILAPTPAAADITRSCTGTLWIYAEDGNRVTREFTIPVTVSSRIYANRARERSRDAIISCVEEHWDMRMSSSRPHWCNEGGNYPFQGFNEGMTDAICAANPGRQSFLVNITLWVHGRDGCHSERYGRGASDWGYYNIAEDYRVYCWIAPQPEVRRGWNLPGRDYHWYYMDAGARSDDCARHCAREGRCEAWTYKHPTGDDPPMCFLKESVPAWRRDNRFVSGIKGEVLH